VNPQDNTKSKIIPLSYPSWRGLKRERRKASFSFPFFTNKMTFKESKNIFHILFRETGTYDLYVVFVNSIYNEKKPFIYLKKYVKITNVKNLQMLSRVPKKRESFILIKLLHTQRTK
jgi:hypothetical protein